MDGQEGTVLGPHDEGVVGRRPYLRSTIVDGVDENIQDDHVAGSSELIGETSWLGCVVRIDRLVRLVRKLDPVLVLLGVVMEILNLPRPQIGGGKVGDVLLARVEVYERPVARLFADDDAPGLVPEVGVENGDCIAGDDDRTALGNTKRCPAHGDDIGEDDKREVVWSFVCVVSISEVYKEPIGPVHDLVSVIDRVTHVFHRATVDLVQREHLGYSEPLALHVLTTPHVPVRRPGDYLELYLICLRRKGHVGVEIHHLEIFTDNVYFFALQHEQRLVVEYQRWGVVVD